MSDGRPDPFVENVVTATAIERQVDSLGDATYQLVERYVSSDERLRLLNETHEAIVTACAGLHALVRVAEEARELSRHLVVREIPQIAAAGANASGDTEERALAPDPQHAPAVAHDQEKRA